MSFQDFRDLLAWQKSMDLVALVYQLSAHFPANEQFGLISQMRRSAVSIPSNIAEGHGRQSAGDFLRFLNIARGSLAELQTQLLLAQRFNMGDQPSIGQALESSEEVGRVLRGLQKSLTLDSKLKTQN